MGHRFAQVKPGRPSTRDAPQQPTDAQNKMAKCKICKTKLNKTWDYCPKCGGKTKEDDYSFIKYNFIWEREQSGQYIYDNFKAIREMGIYPYNKVKPARRSIGDFVHINAYNIRKFSLLSFSPKFALELFKMSKLVGYYDSEIGVRAVHLKERSERLAKTEKFLEIIKEINEKGVDTQSYTRLGCGILEIKEINDKTKKVIFTLDESSSYPIKSIKKVCYEELGAMCGMVEVLTGRIWNGNETGCHCSGNALCEFELWPAKKEEEEPEIDLLTADEAEDILDTLIIDMTHKREIPIRKRIGDFSHIGYDQCMNYLLTHSTKGHEALTKYCGIRVGEKIAKTTDQTETEDTLNYLKELLEYMKIGQITINRRDDEIKIKMHESAYSSGVNNINTKLDIFIAGIIEGALIHASGKKWQVDETRCIATGNPYCEFTCKTK
jgi:predicted hydrocarbon binding protein